MTAEGKNKAGAYPTKWFFVRMITRDISLEDCILDLVDNSIDSAWAQQGSRPRGLAEGADLSAFHIEIVASANEFVIRDNCGGMSLDAAAAYAFSFGRAPSAPHDNFSIGVYGIGMKRAVFKLGSIVRIRSTFRANDGVRTSFAVPINVDEWIRNDAPPWDFDIVDDEPLASDGVEIRVTKLSSETASALGSPAFIQNLRRVLGRDYSLHLQRGLKVTLNDVPVQSWMIELRQSDAFTPMRIEYEDKVNGDAVLVNIVGGMAASPPESNDPDEGAEPDRRHGWYVVCNGRIVVAADKSQLTGWGTEDWPQWHPQYSGFIGVLVFTAANAAALPLTTTKRSVDVSSEVYRRARTHMRSVSRQWIDYTNHRKQALNEAKQIEAAAAVVSLTQVSGGREMRVPNLGTKPRSEAHANVTYSVPMKRLKRLAKELGNINMTYREVGTKSFEYTYDDLVGDE